MNITNYCHLYFDCDVEETMPKNVPKTVTQRRRQCIGKRYRIRHGWKSLPNRLTSDKKSVFMVTHALFWFLHVILCPDRAKHYSDVIMSAMASQITGVSIVCSSVGWGADQREHQSSASLTFVWGIVRWLVNFPHKGPVTRKMFPFDAVIMKQTNNGVCGQYN